MHDVLKHFPFPTFRPGQEELLEKVALLIEGGKDVRVTAPVGVGKSPVACALARWRGPAYITTPLNTLVDQYERDFTNAHGVAILKGRRNYQCAREHVRANECLGTVDPKTRGACLKGIFGCEFAARRLAAISAPVVVTNISMLLSAEWLGRRRLLICDESQSLEPFVQKHVTVDFIEEDLEDPLPDYQTFDEYVEWITALYLREEARANLLEGDIMEKIDHGAPPTKAEMRELADAKEWVKKASTLLSDWATFKEPWIWKRSEYRDKWRRRVVHKLTFQPVTAKRFIRRVLEKGERVVIMSATPPFAADLGMADVVNVEAPMPFPLQNRPIYRYYVGRMDAKYRQEKMPAAAMRILEIAYGKTICHMHTYSAAKLLSAIFTEMRVPHILQDQGNREGSLQEWITSDAQIFISVAMTEGIDLADERCRTNVIACMPFGDLGDPAVSKRCEQEGWGWYYRNAANSVVQAYGRAVRSDTDWARCYILDSNFAHFLKKNRELFPRWFLEAIM